MNWSDKSVCGKHKKQGVPFQSFEWLPIIHLTIALDKGQTKKGEPQLIILF
jgi:hypothetical protein